MKFIPVALAAALVAAPSSAFVSIQSRPSTQLHAVADASALTEYMAKAHEDKLKAIKEAEEKKNVEIEALKKEIRVLQSAPGALVTTPSAPPPTMDIADMTKEQLAQKLISYQQFMAKYIVDAQQQKSKAIQAAEMAVTKKFEDKLMLLGGTTASPPAETNKAFDKRNVKITAAAAAGKSRWGDMENQKAASASGQTLVTPPAAMSAAPASNTVFDARNARVAAAAKAGKSRWGEMENAKAATGAAFLPSSSTPVSAPAPIPGAGPVPAEVEAADHGLRNDGGVGGPSLAERINLGALLLDGSGVAAAAPAPLGSTAAPSYYDKRNAMVAAAGKAGKSRWGEMEVHKVEALASAAPLPSSSVAAAAAITASPEVEAADHGLRNDGGVGGPSLAQRVNLGASLID